MACINRVILQIVLNISALCSFPRPLQCCVEPECWDTGAAVALAQQRLSVAGREGVKPGHVVVMSRDKGLLGLSRVKRWKGGSSKGARCRHQVGLAREGAAVAHSGGDGGDGMRPSMLWRRLLVAGRDGMKFGVCRRRRVKRQRVWVLHPRQDERWKRGRGRGYVVIVFVASNGNTSMPLSMPDVVIIVVGLGGKRGRGNAMGKQWWWRRHKTVDVMVVEASASKDSSSRLGG